MSMRFCRCERRCWSLSTCLKSVVARAEPKAGTSKSADVSAMAIVAATLRADGFEGRSCTPVRPRHPARIGWISPCPPLPRSPLPSPLPRWRLKLCSRCSDVSGAPVPRPSSRGRFTATDAGAMAAPAGGRVARPRTNMVIKTAIRGRVFLRPGHLESRSAGTVPRPPRATLARTCGAFGRGQGEGERSWTRRR